MSWIALPLNKRHPEFDNDEIRALQLYSIAVYIMDLSIIRVGGYRGRQLSVANNHELVLVSWSTLQPVVSVLA